MYPSQFKVFDHWMVQLHPQFAETLVEVKSLHVIVVLAYRGYL